MHMGVGFSWWITGAVAVLMLFVVDMAVPVLQRLMCVCMLMPFRYVEP